MLDETFFGADDVGGDGFFALLVFQDFLFDGVFANHAVGKHFFVLTDAVGAINGIFFGYREFNASLSQIFTIFATQFYQNDY